MTEARYIPLPLEEEQKLLLDVVKYIDHICKSEQIQYFLGYGSLLGAVRHHGFIPWDDDIDLLMTRENYDKFNSTIHKYPREGYFFQNYTTDPNYPVPEISRICIDNTFKWPEGYENAPFHTGIYVDIFPLEYGEKSKEEILTKMKKCAYYHKLMYIKYGPFRISKHPAFMVDELKGKITPIDTLQKKMLSVIDYHEGEVDCSVLCNYGAAFMGGEKLIYDANWFSDSIRMEFSGMMLPCPIGYEGFLTNYYGKNYMTPLKTKTKRHIAYVIK